MTGGAKLQRIPTAAFQQTYTVRSYEVGRSGRIGLGTILRYLEWLATEASAAAGFEFSWYEAHGVAWVVRDMHVMLGYLPSMGEAVRLATWIAEYKRVQAQREYVVLDARSDRLVARASARWIYIDRMRGTPRRIHDEVSQGIAIIGESWCPRNISLLDSSDSSSISTELLVTARETEADSQQHINNCVYGDWLTEGLLHATGKLDAPTSSVIHPRRYSIEYMRPAMPGEEIRISTTLAQRGTRALSVHQDIANAAGDIVYARANSLHLKAVG